MIGRVVGSYRLIDKLGDGGMGAVYKGVDEMIGREVAIKMLRPDIARQPEILERFRAEAVTLAKLNHQGIATLYNFFREGDEYFMAMEFVPGCTLENELQRQGRIASGQAVEIAAKALEAIEHAHQLGILHRDIKPANIMLTPSGTVKMTDFGIARVLGAARMTREGRIVGTLEYIAPERVKGQEADHRSDLYSLGIVLYEMLAGRLPFEATTDYDLMRAHLEQTPPPLAGVQAACPPALEQVMLRALAKDPEQRFATAVEFRDALLTASENLPKPTRLAEAPAVLKPTRLDQPAKASKRSPKWTYVAAAAGVFVLAAGLVAYRFLNRPAPPPAPAATISVPTAPPPAPPGMESGSAPVIPGLAEKPSVDDLLEQGKSMAGTPPTAGPAKPATSARSKSRSDAARRKAALRALGEEENTTHGAAPKSDARRSDALKALEK